MVYKGLKSLSLAGAGILLSATVTFADVPFKLPGQDISRGTVSGVTSVAVGDIDRDGLPDIALFEGGKHAGGRQVFAWFEAPNWTRHNFSTTIKTGPFLGDSKLADIDKDGYLDLILPQDSHSSGPGYLYWYRNPKNGSTGNWSRQLIATWRDAYHIGEIEVADMDGDGKLDVVVRHLGTKSVRICFQNSPTDWTTRTLAVRNREGLKLADLDRDGKTDIILNGFWWATPSNPRTGTYTEFVIDKTFYTQPIEGLNNSTKCGVGDLDGDGIQDVVMVPAEGQKAYLAWYKGPSNPRTQGWTRHIIENSWGNMHQAEIGDFDKDGDLDIGGGRSFGESGVFIWYNNNKGQSWTRQTLTTSAGMYSGIAHDIGADGDLDLVGPSFYSKTSTPLLYENLLGTTAPASLVTPSTLTATATTASSIRLTWRDNNTSESGFAVQRRTGTGEFTEIARVGSNVTAFENTGLTPNTTYFYRVLAYNAAGTSGFSNEATATTPESSSPPPTEYTWANRDIGAVSARGGATWSENGSCTVTGSGNDIWYTADEFHFVYQMVSGDGELTARVASRTGGDEWAKAGLMIRESLAANSKHCLMQVSRSHGTMFDYRTATGGTTAKTSGNDTMTPACWLKIKRVGSVLTGYVSTDGNSWRQVGSKSVSMGSTVYWGLAVTSHQDGTLSTAGFDNIAISGSSIGSEPIQDSPAPLSAPTNLSGSALSETAIRLNWSDNNSAESGFRIFRRTGTTSFAQIGQVGANVTTFQDNGLTGDTSYTYQLVTFDSTQTSAPSNETTIRTLAPSAPAPVDWANKDIGAVAVTGRSSWDGTGKFTVTGSGKDIWYTADEFQFVYKALEGDGELIARVASQTGGDQWAKAGVMVRETLQPNSKHSLMELTRLNGSIFDFRTSTGGTTAKISGNDTLKPPTWIRIKRSGSTFTGYTSVDGTTWRQVGSKSVSMAGTAFWGLAVTSHQDGTLSTAVFDGVKILSSAQTQSFAASSFSIHSPINNGEVNEFVIPKASTEIIGGETYFNLVLTRSINASQSALTVQTSNNLKDWADAAYFGNSNTGMATDTLVETARATAGDLETINLRSTVPVNEMGERYLFFRVLVEE